jgi:hypothetical protein
MPRKRILTDQEIAEKAKRLIYLIDFSKINRKELCKDTGIKADTLYRWMNGRLQGIGPSGAASLLLKLREFGIICSEDWLLYGEGLPPYRALAITEGDSLPLPALISSELNQPQVHELSPQLYHPSAEIAHRDLLVFNKEIQFFQENNPNSLGVFLKDNSMQPVFMAGDYVAGVRTQQFEKLLGEFCLVQIEQSGEVLACRLEAGLSNTFTLLCLNPNESRPLLLLNQKLITAARIIWRRRPYY